MNVIAWITFIRLMIEAGAILVSYGVSIANPKDNESLKDLIGLISGNMISGITRELFR